jgi:hypothetical protein
MPILIDISQVALANVLMSPNVKETAKDGNLIKHMIFNSLRAYKQQFKHEYGDLVICADNKEHYWRRDYFPHYKWSRKKNREKSDIDWIMVYKAVEDTLKDLKEYFPYKFINVYGAEADDVIAVICKNENNPTVIVSGDKDYAQLHGYPHVNQYSPRLKDFIYIENPAKALKELILTGDSGDGIPNIKSDSNCFVVGKRQSSMFKKDIDVWVYQKPEEFCTDVMLENYQRNRTLIDFEYIPEKLQNDIMEAYSIQPTKTKQDISDYFIQNGMRNLYPLLGEF